MAKTNRTTQFRAVHFLDLLSNDLDCISRTDTNPTLAYSVDRMRNRFLRRYTEGQARNARADRAAVDKFVHINANQLPFIGNAELDGEMRDFIHTVLERGTRVFSDRVGPIGAQQSLDLPTVFQFWNVGKGANNGVPGTHFCDKMDGAFSYTNGATMYLGYLAHVSPTVFLRKNESARALVSVNKVRGSKMSTVPKNQDISRTTAKEPLLNMCTQLAAGNFIAASLSLFGLDISTQQEKNKLLAKLGSIRGDGLGLRLSTIDLESASDRILPDLVKAYFPTEWYHFLMSIRSEVTSVPGHGELRLTMMSTMGNGFTFALMTLIFAALVYALFRSRWGTKRNAIDWSRAGVYGDDIIIPHEFYAEACSALHNMGFVVNNNKSYDVGYFRESCGGDYYNGFDVTPVYIKSLVTQQERIIALNQLLRWCRRNNIWLSCLYYLRDGIRPEYRNPVPMFEDDYAGIKTPVYRPSYTALRIRQEPILYEGSIPLACALGGYVDVEPVVDSLGQFKSWGNPTYTTREAKTRRFRQQVPCTVAWAGTTELNPSWDIAEHLL